MKSDALIDAITGVTKKWTAQRRREERDRSAAMNRRHYLVRRHTVSIKEAAWRVMQEAFMQASANNTLPANARQIMYAARPKIAQFADRELGGTFDKYFTQSLLPEYIAARRPAWAARVVYDERGHFAEPHGKTEIGLGTLAVRNYLAGVRAHNPSLGSISGKTNIPPAVRRTASAGSCSLRKKASVHCSKRCDSPSATTWRSCRPRA
jgi:hypothetical protein